MTVNCVGLDLKRELQSRRWCFDEWSLGSLFKTLGKPLWQVLSEMDPKQTIALIDWTYLRDALDPDAALERLQEQQQDERSDVTNSQNRLSGYYFRRMAWLQ